MQSETKKTGLVILFMGLDTSSCDKEPILSIVSVGFEMKLYIIYKTTIANKSGAEIYILAVMK